MEVISWIGSFFPMVYKVPIDFVRLLVNSNVIVIAAVASIHICYFFGQKWTKHMDLIDYFMYKRAININDIPSGVYKYLITIYTNWRPGSGTDAKVFIQLHGCLGQNTICYFLHNPYYPHRRLFGWSDVSWFLLNTSIPIGNLRSITIAHDNSGTFAAWHLSRVIVRDVQLNKSRRFLANCWLTEDNGSHPGASTSVTLKPIDPDYVEPFGERLFEWARRIYRDRPLTSWYSLDYITSLSRSQRLMITYVYLLTLMLLNIAYFQSTAGTFDQLAFILGMTFRTAVCYAVLIVLNLILKQNMFTVRQPTKVQHYLRLAFYSFLHLICLLQSFLVVFYCIRKGFDTATSLRWLFTFGVGILQSELMIAVGVTLSKALMFTLLCKDPYTEEAAKIQLTERVSNSCPFINKSSTPFTQTLWF